MHRLIVVVMLATLLWSRHGGADVSVLVGSDSVTVRADALRRHVEVLSKELAPRDAEHTENLDKVALYIERELSSAGGRILHQPYQVGAVQYRNVRALFGPETPDRIVIGAHYDAAGPHPGADDNASGVAGLLELARLLQHQALPTLVELVAYSLEEPPNFRTANMGSAHHAALLHEEGANVRVMISLEMIGFFSDAKNSQKFPLSLLKLFYPDQGNFIAVIGTFGQTRTVRRVRDGMRGANTIAVRSLTAPAWVRGVDFSDHMNYWKYDYPAVMVTDTSFYRNPNYHTDSDLPDTLDYESMARVVAAVRAAVVALSHAP